MANSTQMALELAEQFKVELVSVEVHSRGLMERGLRAKGGRGRGATRMQGRDICNTAIAVASGLGPRDTPDFVHAVEHLELHSGVMTINDDVVWTAPIVVDGSFSWIHKAMPNNPLPDVRIMEKFGSFIAGWVDGLFDAGNAWKERGDVTVSISNIGPTAQFEFVDGPVLLSLGFAPNNYGATATKAPSWERITILRGDLLRKLVTVIEA